MLMVLFFDFYHSITVFQIETIARVSDGSGNPVLFSTDWERTVRPRYALMCLLERNCVKRGHAQKKIIQFELVLTKN